MCCVIFFSFFFLFWKSTCVVRWRSGETELGKLRLTCSNATRYSDLDRILALTWHENVIWDWNCNLHPVEDTNNPESYHCYMFPLFRLALCTDKIAGCSYYLGLIAAYWFCFMLCLNQLSLFYTILRGYFIYWVSFKSESHSVRLMSTIS